MNHKFSIITPAHKNKAEVELTEEFKNVIKSVENSTSSNSKFIFVTGSAGTGGPQRKQLDFR